MRSSRFAGGSMAVLLADGKMAKMIRVPVSRARKTLIDPLLSSPVRFPSPRRALTTELEHAFDLFDRVLRLDQPSQRRFCLPDALPLPQHARHFISHGLEFSLDARDF